MTSSSTSNSNQQLSARPTEMTVEREAGLLKITWTDNTVRSYPLRWLRANCPCATCREEIRKAESDPLHLVVGPPPSTEIVGGETVGNYAIRFEWADGHATGIYPFSMLYEAVTESV
ncbi:MAG: DUF971 domain-containing protein [Chloroflexota bacterium]